MLDDARDPPTWQLSDHLKVQVPGKSSGHRMGSVNSLFEFSELKPGHSVSECLPNISDLKKNLCLASQRFDRSLPHILSVKKPELCLKAGRDSFACNFLLLDIS